MTTPAPRTPRAPRPAGTSIAAIVILSYLGGLFAAPDASRAQSSTSPAESKPETETPPATPSAPKPAPGEPVEPKESEPEAVVFLKDGRRQTGYLVRQDEERIVLRIGRTDILMPFPVELVDRLFILAPVIDRYRQMRAAIDDGDSRALIELAGWLRDRGRIDLALEEINALIERDPANAQAKRTRLLLEQQKALQDSAVPPNAAAPGAVGPDAAHAANPAPPRREPAYFPVLSPDQINLLKVYEVDLSNPPRLIIERDVIESLLESSAGNPLIPSTREGREALFRRPAPDILDLMFRLQARSFYGRVKVLDHPAAFKDFRDRVHGTWLINACATNQCHGGAEAGRLQLLNRRSNADATFYTNFLILDRYRLGDGAPLIDYEQPASSPLLQIALPRTESTHPHPPVPGPGGVGDRFRAVFRSTDDRKFQEAVSWIRKMYRPRPEYPVQYTPPKPSQPPEPGEAPPAVER